MSTSTTERTPIIAMKQAVIDSIREENDTAAAVLVKALLNEVRRTQPVDLSPGMSRLAFCEGLVASELLENAFPAKPDQGKREEPQVFPKTKGVLIGALLEGWKHTFSLHGDKERGNSFARSLGRAFGALDSKESDSAREALATFFREINTHSSSAAKYIAEFLLTSSSSDDPWLLREMGRNLGHHASRQELMLMSAALLAIPTGYTVEAFAVAMQELALHTETFRRAEIGLSVRRQLGDDSYRISLSGLHIILKKHEYWDYSDPEEIPTPQKVRHEELMSHVVQKAYEWRKTADLKTEETIDIIHEFRNVRDGKVLFTAKRSFRVKDR